MKIKSGKLEVLIAAQNIRSTDELPQVALQLLSEGSAALIINQTNSEPDFESPSQNLRIFHYHENGICRSRNRALQRAQGSLLLITDDDVELLGGFSDTIVEAFDNNPEADIITFQCLNEHGDKRKNYSAASFWHNLRTLMRVSSVEIAIRRESLKRKSLFFDNRFGIGSLIPTGGETVFLGDAHKLGFKILYLPLPIVKHPDASSGRALYQNTALIKAKGSLFYRIFGWKAYGVCILFALKKRKETGYSLTKNIQLMYAGINEFKVLDHGN
jgi:glycosyltransferase involved in cell wall biosynthesis